MMDGRRRQGAASDPVEDKVRSTRRHQYRLTDKSWRLLEAQVGTRKKENTWNEVTLARTITLVAQQVTISNRVMRYYGRDNTSLDYDREQSVDESSGGERIEWTLPAETKLNLVSGDGSVYAYVQDYVRGHELGQLTIRRNGTVLFTPYTGRRVGSASA